ncbi:MAG TPA: 2OG-Fe(II) oxygenase [Bryobacteraceae bacterium]|nr:2OG-Fe(II) oxygenase [Bryobacteraceae bacterium]
MVNGIAPTVTESADELAGKFAAARPFRHVIVDDFFEPGLCAELVEQFPRFDRGHSLNESGRPGKKSTIQEVRSIGAAYRRVDQIIRSVDFLRLIATITGIGEPLYDPDYVGGGTHETLPGGELDPHVDFNYHPRTRLHRRLNLIVFLNPRWESEWGGCLELLSDPWDRDPQRIVPVANRAVLFETTESSWHGFDLVNPPEGLDISRRSFAIYFYSKARPATQMTASHGTFYYQRQLPEHIRSGRTLSEEDAREIQRLIDRRDHQIRFLYERELRFSKLIEGITNSASFRVGRAFTWPIRMLRGKSAKADPVRRN